MTAKSKVLKVYPDAVCDRHGNTCKVWEHKSYWAKLLGTAKTEAAAWQNALNNIEHNLN
jgi:hypothetical protein